MITAVCRWICLYFDKIYAMKLFMLALLFSICSCAKKDEMVSGSNANRENIVRQFNKIRLHQDRSIDSVGIAAIEEAAANEPAEYQSMALILKGIYYHNVSSYALGLQSFETALWKARSEEHTSELQS